MLYANTMRQAQCQDMCAVKALQIGSLSAFAKELMTRVGGWILTVECHYGRACRFCASKVLSHRTVLSLLWF